MTDIREEDIPAFSSDFFTKDEFTTMWSALSRSLFMQARLASLNGALSEELETGNRPLLSIKY
jgi:hypothetical protein